MEGEGKAEKEDRTERDQMDGWIEGVRNGETRRMGFGSFGRFFHSDDDPPPPQCGQSDVHSGDVPLSSSCSSSGSDDDVADGVAGEDGGCGGGGGGGGGGRGGGVDGGDTGNLCVTCRPDNVNGLT